MATLLDEDSWEDLLTLVEEGKVIPIVGDGVIVTEGGERLSTWLAAQLAKKLDIAPDHLPQQRPPTLNDVVCRHLVKGGDRTDIYLRLHRILRDSCPEPGPAVRALASIRDFNLYLSTTFDPLLERSLNQVRFGGEKRADVLAFSPGGEEGAAKDLPSRKSELARATVYHLLGRVSTSPEYVVWEEDALEFICALHQHLPVMERLARELKNNSLLILGLNFSDWLVCFFLRIAKQARLTELRDRMEYIGEVPTGALPETMVLFFGGSNRKVHVVPCDPVEFVIELARRWEARAPQPKPTQTAPPALEMPRGAIFLSYAREDEAAAITLKAGLESTGCTVWYDRERLKGGANFERRLDEEVKERCALFLAVVSRNTEKMVAGYVLKERAWAAERAEMFAESEIFYVPVVIDDTPLPLTKEPRRFRNAHVQSLPGGAVTSDFAGHIAGLWKRNCSGLFSE